MKKDIFSKLLVKHERNGTKAETCTCGKINIPRSEVKQTLIDLKIWFVSLGRGYKSKDAREHFKQNYHIID